MHILLEFGASISMLDKEGEMELHLGAASGHEELVSLALTHGAEIDKPSHKGIHTLTSCSSKR